ncbi:MAG: hypothetical protein U9N61_12390 [Euryarchaeota archaeon]|nr:hypothetical protein [Euryarchaeota archaeon]
MDEDAITNQLQGGVGLSMIILHTTPSLKRGGNSKKNQKKSGRKKPGQKKMTQGMYVVLRKIIGHQSMRGS